MNVQYSMFSSSVLGAPKTEGIKYAGSKLRLLPAIIRLTGKTSARKILDGFSGTTRVSQALAKSGYDVVCNDTAHWSEVFGTCYLLNQQSPASYRALIDHLNFVPPIDGWFTEHYGGSPNDGSSIQHDGLKKPWQRHNTRKLDAIRQEIEDLGLSGVERSVALASLMLALDRVDNTLGHFVSYLSEWSQRSYNNLLLTIPEFSPSSGHHEVFRNDIFDVLEDDSIDLAYFDPPYGSNNEKMPPSRVRYSSYYHVWTSVCLFDKPNLFGKANRRIDSSDKLATSVFEEFRKNSEGRFVAVEAIERLVRRTRARWIILSYSSGGRATAEELQHVMMANGRIKEIIEINHKKNVMAEMRWTNEWVRDAELPNREFLFLLER